MSVFSSKKSPFALALAALVAGQILLIWLLPVLPGHDLPQHLAYVRVLADFDDPALALKDAYVLAPRFDPYFAIHHGLALLARAIGVVPACRVLYSGYALGLTLACTALCRAAWPHRTPWPALLSVLLVWNLVTWMGFLTFMLSMPLAVATVAAHVRGARTPSPKNALVAMGLAAATASVHVISGGMLVLFATLHALAAWDRRAVRSAGAVAAGALLAAVAWRRGAAPIVWDELARAMREYGAWEGSVGFFRASWTGAAEKANLVRATLLGPFTFGPSGLVALALLAIVAAAAIQGRASMPRFDREQRGYVRAVLLFGLACLVIPTSVQVPDDICLIDLRMLGLWALLAIAAVPPVAFDKRASRTLVVLAMAAATLVGGRQLFLVSREASAVLRLIRPLGPSDRVLALPMHGASEHLDPTNGLTHYLPLYHTVYNAGPTSSFWGGLLPHLPVMHRKEPLRPPDWAPWKVEPTHVEAATHVLLERPDPDEDEGSAVTATLLADPRLSTMGCDGRWCLLRVVDERRGIAAK